MEIDLAKTGIVVGVIAISCSAHESAHAWMALKLGDTTGRDEGRISLNPLKHIDPVFTILMPAIMLIATNGRFAFGGAKPVAINHYNFKNPALGLAISAAVGPISNFLIALLTILVWYGVYIISPTLVLPDSYNSYFFYMMFLLNIVLGVFNLIPIPPLDGSRAFRLLLGQNMQRAYDMIEFIGIFLILGLILATNVIHHVVGFFAAPFMTLLLALFDADYIRIVQSMQF